MRGSNAALSAAFNVSAYPTLLAVCNGDPASAQRYGGELKSDRIAAFLVRWRCIHVLPGAPCLLGAGLGLEFKFCEVPAPHARLLDGPCWVPTLPRL